MLHCKHLRRFIVDADEAEAVHGELLNEFRSALAFARLRSVAFFVSVPRLSGNAVGIAPLNRQARASGFRKAFERLETLAAADRNHSVTLGMSGHGRTPVAITDQHAIGDTLGIRRIAWLCRVG